MSDIHTPRSPGKSRRPGKATPERAKALCRRLVCALQSAGGRFERQAIAERAGPWSCQDAQMTRRRLRSTTARGERIARPTARAKSGGAIRWKRQITTRKALAQKRRVRGAWRCEKGASDANLVSGDRRMRWCTRPLFRRTANEISPAALPRGGYSEMRGFEGGIRPIARTALL